MTPVFEPCDSRRTFLGVRLRYRLRDRLWARLLGGLRGRLWVRYHKVYE